MKTTKETIKEELIARGWHTHQIEELFLILDQLIEQRMKNLIVEYLEG